MRKLVLTLTTLIFFITSCKEELDTSARYVFTEYTVASYLEAHAEYSQYVELTKQVTVSRRSESSVYQLLTARGNFTCFALTNKAIDEYLQSLVEEGLISEPSWDAFTDDYKRDSVLKVVVLNTIIDGGDYDMQRYRTALITSFGSGDNAEFPLPTLNDHKLTVLQDKNYDIYLDKECLLDSKNCDIPLTNGILHQLHKVIAPKDESCERYLQNILDNKIEGYLMFARAVQACGLLDTLGKVRDEKYENLYQKGEIRDMEKYMDKGGYDMSETPGDPDAHAPEHRKYGFTLFCEPDDYWKEKGLDPTASDAVERLQSYISDNNLYLSNAGYVVNTDYKSPKNMLHQWVVYHILPMRIPANKLVYHCNEIGHKWGINNAPHTIPVMEWYPVFEGGRLLKIYESLESQGIYLNTFPQRNKGINEDGHEKMPCPPGKRGWKVLNTSDKAVVTDISNACIYPIEPDKENGIDEPLHYNNTISEDMGKERIRFDLFSLFPESITNDIRRKDSPDGKSQHVFVSLYNAYKYFDNMFILNEETHLIHYNGYRTDWANYCQDEDKAFGHFDIMFRLPPVPMRNTYEFRYKLLATAARGIVQVYFGSDPKNLPVAGIPIDMTKNVQTSFGENATWADLQDNGKDEDEIIEIDHKLRNHGLMKAANHEQDSKSARAKDNCSRHIIVRQTLDPNETYYVRFKSVQPDLTRPELYLDCFEYCPKEIYDSPFEPEDIW